MAIAVDMAKIRGVIESVNWRWVIWVKLQSRLWGTPAWHLASHECPALPPSRILYVSTLNPSTLVSVNNHLM